MFHNAHAIVQLIVVFVLFIVEPFWDYFETNRLKKNPALRIRYYRNLIATLWILASAACWSSGTQLLLRIRATPANIHWLFGNPISYAVVVTLTAVFFVVAFLPGIRSMAGQRVRQAYARAFERVSYFYFLPVTAKEKNWYAALSLSAGVCEELLFRGFLLFYLTRLPLHLSLTWALIVSSIGFGLNHLYQGMSGTITTTLAGFCFGLAFVLTGNLLLPILLHTLIDLQTLIFLQNA